MKNVIVKMVSLLMLVSFLLSASMLCAFAEQSVDIIGNKTAAYSSKVGGTWKFINNTTKNFSNSSQRMRAQFEVSDVKLIPSWVSEQRIFINVNATAPKTESNRYAFDKYFRLALSPENQTLKGVFGTGIIYY